MDFYKYQIVDITNLKKYAKNARIHSEIQINQIVESIKEFGFTNPLLIDGELNIIAGHGRLDAAILCNMHQIPCIVLSGINEAQKQALIIADNQLSINATWDTDLLKTEIQNLVDLDFNVDILGFDDDFLSDILEVEVNTGLTDDDEIPDLPEIPISKTGDIWILGNHRLMCGDCMIKENIELLTQNNHIDCVVTDPPYGLGGTDSEKNNYNLYSDTKENLLNIITNFLPISIEFADRVIITPGNRNQFLYKTPDWVMAWFTPAGVGRGPWGFCCWQPILCYGKDVKLQTGKGSHPDAIVHTEASEKNIHPCSKPVNFWCWLIERNTNEKNTVMDFFCGSGTTLIACEKTKRSAYTIEIDPLYIDLAITRWQDFTNKEAILELTGENFDKVKESRL